jgi:hypothetical protein
MVKATPEIRQRGGNGFVLGHADAAPAPPGRATPTAVATAC